MTDRQKQIKVKHDELVALLKVEFEEHESAIKQDANYKPKTAIAAMVSVGFYERPETGKAPYKASLNSTVGGDEIFFNHMIQKGLDQEAKDIIHDCVCPAKAENPFEALFTRMKTRN